MSGRTLWGILSTHWSSSVRLLTATQQIHLFGSAVCVSTSSKQQPGAAFIYLWLHCLSDSLSSLFLLHLCILLLCFVVCCSSPPQHLELLLHCVWMDSRVQEGHRAPFEEFQTEFESRMASIGHLLAILAPWDCPVYVTRVHSLTISQHSFSGRFTEGATK